MICPGGRSCEEGGCHVVREGGMIVEEANGLGEWEGKRERERVRGQGDLRV